MHNDESLGLEFGKKKSWNREEGMNGEEKIRKGNCGDFRCAQ